MKSYDYALIYNCLDDNAACFYRMKEAIDEQIDMLELNLRHREDCELKKRELKAQYHFKKMESVRNGYEQLLNIESELENDMKKLMEEYRRLRDGATPKAN